MTKTTSPSDSTEVGGPLEALMFYINQVRASMKLAKQSGEEDAFELLQAVEIDLEDAHDTMAAYFKYMDKKIEARESGTVLT